MYLGVALAFACGVAGARDDPLPPANLRVEWRWVSVAGAAPAPSAQGAGPYVVGTRRGDSATQPVQQLIVANGETAGIALTERTPHTAMEYAVDLPLPGQRPMPVPHPPVVRPVAQAGTRHATGTGIGQRRAQGIEVYAVPREDGIDRTRGFEAGVRWAGGARPVRVRLRAALPSSEHAPDAQGEIDTVVYLDLGVWQTVAIGAGSASRGGAAADTREIDSTQLRELQLRVTLAR